MTNEIIKKMQNLKPGESMVYFTSDYSPLANCGDATIRNEAYKLHIADKVELVQRLVKRHRNDFGKEISVHEYIAIGKIRPPRKQTVIARQNYVDHIERKSEKKKLPMPER